MTGHSLDDLALLVDVVRAGGVRAVARARGVPRSTVSRRLARLEKSVGVRLTTRGAGALALSEAAEASFERLARLVDEARDVSAELSTRAKEPQGVLRVTTTHRFAEYVLPPIAAKYLAQYPRVRLEVLSSGERINLAAERIDVAIRGGALEDSSSFTARRLGVLTVGLFASPRYARRRGLPKSVAELGEHELLVTSARSAGAQWTFRRGGRLERVGITGRVFSSNDSFLVSLCEEGAGIARAPTFMVADQLARGRLVPVLESTWVQSELHLVYALGAPPRTRAFVDLVGTIS